MRQGPLFLLLAVRAGETLPHLWTVSGVMGASSLSASTDPGF